MRFFFDNCISPKLARALNILADPEHRVVPLRDEFAASTPDVEWIPKLAAQGGWIIVSGDLHIKTRPRERELWRAAKLTTFFMADAFPRLPEWEQVRWMIDKWPLIVEQAARVTPGSAFQVPKKGQKLSTI